jgi:hypothetical protein
MKFAMVKSVLICAAVVLAALPATLSAQLNYPSFQVPTIAEREFNFAIADARRTTSLVFQWRESMGGASQLSFDAGFADLDRDDSGLALLLGGQYAYQMLRATSETPLDILFATGVFTRLGGGRSSAMSIPVGVSLGHRFPLEGQLAITPYIHPRLSIDVFRDNTELSINFDVGASFDFTNQLGLRFSATLGEVDAVGISLAWRPMGLRR